MRLMVAAFLVGSMLCMPALATEKPAPVIPPAAETKPEAAKPEAPKPAAKPVHVPANKPVDYGDMRCGFAVRHRDVLDSQIIAWAGGFLEGYARANPEHVNNARLTELTDPSVLRTHIRGYCLKHKEKSIEAALLAMMPHASHPTEAPAARPAAPAPQKPTPAKPQ
ncbi:SPOR domain-containing protein [Labrys okinawensis]|uniref:SPOR domain-containing protein n=1 Tax=Labrys okinawensis TaxID=346911 RepID=UPI0039BD55CD